MHIYALDDAHRKQRLFATEAADNKILISSRGPGTEAVTGRSPACSHATGQLPPPDIRPLVGVNA